MAESNIITKRKVDLAAFAQAMLSDSTRWSYLRLNRFGDAAYPIYPTDVVFGLYTWMLRATLRANVVERGRWGDHSAFGEVASPSGAVNVWMADPISGAWRRQIARALISGMVGQGLTKRWREKGALDPLSEVWVTGKFHRDAPHAALDWELDGLFGLVGRQTRVSFNEFHPDARWIVGVQLLPSASLWSACLEYGIDGSVWEADPRPLSHRYDGETVQQAICLQSKRVGGTADPNPLRPTQAKGESLIHFVARVRRTFEEYLLPKATSECSQELLRCTSGGWQHNMASPIWMRTTWMCPE